MEATVKGAALRGLLAEMRALGQILPVRGAAEVAVGGHTIGQRADIAPLDADAADAIEVGFDNMPL